MKKILALCLAVIMLFSVSVTTLAAGTFVSSPSGNDAPVVEDFENESEDCDSTIKITSFADRDSLPADIREKMEKAYEQIAANADLTDLSDELATLAKKAGVDSEDLAVSDLFDISYFNCDDHDEHGYFTITLKTEALANFVALLHLNGSKWEVVKSAKVTGNGAKLTFKIDDFSPFAIVVNKAATSPVTSNDFNASIVVALVSVIALAGLTLIIRKRKA